MAILDLNVLKQRFSTRDQPTQRDFIDLIDTLLAGASLLPPAGPAGGVLTGNYPDPGLADGVVSYDKMQNVPASKLLGRGQGGGTGIPQEITVGSGLTMSGTTLVTSAAAGGGTTANVTGSVVVFTDSQELPATDDVLTFTAPVSFGGNIPQHKEVVAVCIEAFATADYAVGDEVPLDQFRMKENPETPAFVVSWYISGGLVNCKVKVEYGTPGPTAGLAVYHKTSPAWVGTAPDPTLIPFLTIVAAQAAFAIKVSASRFESGTGFGSITTFQGTPVAIPAAGSPADDVIFSHNFGVQPTFEPRVTLLCITNDTAVTGYDVGEELDIKQSFETAFANPAFGVSVTADEIVVQREATTIAIPHKTTGILTNITVEARWNIKAVCSRGVASPTLIFPSTTFVVAYPQLAVSYGEQIFVMHCYGSDQFLSSINLTNSVVTQRLVFGAASVIPHGTILRMPMGGATPVDFLYWCDTAGIHRMRLDDFTIVTLAGPSVGAYGGYRVLDATELSASVDDVAHPRLIVAVDNWSSGSGDTANYLMAKVVWSGTIYVHTAYTPFSWPGLTGVLGPVSIYNSYHNTNANVLGIMYNPIKKRIYIVDNAIGFLSIFQITGAASLFAWLESASPPTGSQLTYEKAIALGGDCNTSVNVDYDQYTLEFDQVTGAEVAVCISRVGQSNVTGTVTRIPWME